MRILRWEYVVIRRDRLRNEGDRPRDKDNPRSKQLRMRGSNVWCGTWMSFRRQKKVRLALEFEAFARITARDWRFRCRIRKRGSKENALKFGYAQKGLPLCASQPAGRAALWRRANFIAKPITLVLLDVSVRPSFLQISLASDKLWLSAEWLDKNWRPLRIHLEAQYSFFQRLL